MSDSQAEVEARLPLAALAAVAAATRRGDGDRAARRPRRRSRSASCPTARARSARSTPRTWPASSPRCRSSRAPSRRTRTSRAQAGPGASITGHPLKLVGVGCGNDNADKAIKETQAPHGAARADIMIGPLSGDESIAVANYAKQHPTKTFVDGAAGAQDTTLKVRAPNFFRFNGDGAQWNAGLGDLAYNKLGWKTAAVVADDYSFGWTSAAGFIAEFCAVGGKVTKRVFPPLNTTDYSSYAQQLPTNVDGTFVGGRRRRPDPVPEGLRAGARPDRRQEVHRQPVLGHAGRVPAARHPRRRRVRRRRRHGRRPRDAGGEGLQRRGRQGRSRRSRRSARPLRRPRRRSRTATTSTPGACSRA